MDSKIWLSPDRVIEKEILEDGNFGPKPTECSICKIKFSEINLKENLSEYLSEIETDSKTERSIIVGEGNTFVDRKIDEVLLTIQKGEMCKITINSNENSKISFKLNLIDFETKGFIYQWTAEEKCKIALHHKEEGIKLFQKFRYKDASHRFSKSLKLLLSIPIPSDEIPEKIDTVTLSDLNSYKANLYNNLASCYSKENRHTEVIQLCSKVLNYDEGNVKALCKRGFAYAGDRDFENAKIDLEKVLEQDKNNKAVIEKLNFINNNINEQQVSVNEMIKKMFVK